MVNEDRASVQHHRKPTLSPIVASWVVGKTNSGATRDNSRFSVILHTSTTIYLSPNLVKSRSHEIGCYNDCIALKFDRHLGSNSHSFETSRDLDVRHSTALWIEAPWYHSDIIWVSWCKKVTLRSTLCSAVFIVVNCKQSENIFHIYIHKSGLITKNT